MNSNDLTRDQGEQVHEETRGMLDRLYALKVRMDERGFPPDDPVYAATVEAWPASSLVKATPPAQSNS